VNDVDRGLDDMGRVSPRPASALGLLLNDQISIEFEVPTDRVGD
jgi:hypothetical protein